MSFLFYLNQQNNIIGLSNFVKFINYVNIYIEYQIVILCESEFDKDGLGSLLIDQNITKIIYLYELDEQSSKNFKQTTDSNQLNHLKIVEPNRFNEEYTVKNIVSILEYKFCEILEKYKVEKVHFGIQQIFRSIGFVILQGLLKKKYPILHDF